MAGEDDRRFDRRRSDLRVDALDTRMKALEEHVFDVLTPMVKSSAREMEANTALTEETHGWVAEVREELTGQRAQTTEMYDVFSAAKNAIHVMTKIGDGLVKAAEFGGKVARPLFWITLLFGSLWGYFTGGEFHWPRWPQ